LHRLALMIAVAACAVPVGASAAQPASQAASTIDGRAVALEVKRLLNQNYVLPEARPKFAAVLDKGIASGRYAVSDEALLVTRLNEDLALVTADKHLGVMYDPERSKALAAAAGGGADDAPPSADEVRQSERNNHGLTRMEVLPGNIRYLEISSFDWAGPSSERAYDTAMAFLAGGDAVIIDVRPNGGGSPEAVRYAVSHFIAPNKPLMTFFMGGRGEESTASLPSTRAPRMVGKPLYVLSSKGSASAAEEFLGHIDGYKLGEVIGERSAGAGFRNEFFALPSGLIISISVGRAVLASTGKDWEAVGIAPALETSADKALDAAKVRALQRVAAGAEPKRKAQLEAIAAALNAQINPVKTELPLAAYAGVYGERTVQADDKGLTIRRGEHPPSQLIAVGPNRFAYANDPQSTVTFAVSAGKSGALHLVRADGSEAHGERSN
jgi:hypothetical protein